MELIPAIDLQDGRCVRLYQGDFAQSTVYADDPVEVARRWQAQGAQRIHVVDLDGARSGRPTNRPAIQAIVNGISIPVQLGGGLRSEADVRNTLALGVERVILGTAAVEQADLVARLVAAFGPQIIVGVDARDGNVATAGWLNTAALRAVDLIAHMAQLGVQRIIYTDISRDGTLTEPNYHAMAEVVKPNGPAIIASGGVAELSQLQRLATLGVEAAIVGKALYAGKFSLAEAIDSLK
ncbi:1-(5-phosphoribosyl)-5-[(5-phosphoribosylamino)methylideneamino]imidazole-4-carboxamide isomerase [Candidatus Viridilinea mediisalina]|uniref:1-(5-phosphoribosyl)-5-[(5-phosphoribosylamino)methylideneamino] imidazole-4-carboxamide isomerase n=1 Tax=Candidatus Viridilinea mediisalina TaxID=2024553 RepID=A0A2A6RFU3_9CHLR|nr:1-(5-phosphoribosyl)-5-[(5-phosphoribosylamino)methylideneamino]imidazole-4-carboxamide isomerase [Candidatus Viridilinea mediisalina]PDW01730.1 1-(5-phosphoribosyl)-5-[(5-phosphoribosylamino)methylideneamino]imidazole-4-carboxamide isomerase [Candidatus Viridilinea mediisalina]